MADRICAQCGSEVDDLDAVEQDGLTFCSEGCADEHLQEADEDEEELDDLDDEDDDDGDDEEDDDEEEGKDDEEDKDLGVI